MFNLIFYTMIKSLNTEYQGQVEEAFELLSIYNELDNRRNEAEALDLWSKVEVYDKQCERVFNDYLEAIEDLPQDEIDNIDETLYS